MDIPLRPGRGKLSARITIRVEPEIKQLFDECMESADVAEDLRGYLRGRLPRIQAKIQEPDAGAPPFVDIDRDG